MMKSEKSFFARVVAFLYSGPGRYATALLMVAVSTGLLLLLRAFYAQKSPSYALIILASLMAAAWWGYGPGVLALAVTAFAVPYVFNRNFNPAQSDFKNLLLLLIISLLISRIASVRDQVEAELRKSNQELDLRVRQRTTELERANAEAHQRLAELENL